MKILIKEKLSEHKYKTPEGYLICTDAILARTGTQEYNRKELYNDNEHAEVLVSVDRHPEEVFDKRTIASFENKPVTVEHPDVDVNSANCKEYAVGFVRDVHKGIADGQEVLLGTLVITDLDAVQEIEDGQHTNLSCGYDCDIMDEANPQQTNIRGNHVALCENPRAGITRIVDSNDASGADLQKYQTWIDYDLKHYGHVTESTLNVLKAEGIDFNLLPHMNDTCDAIEKVKDCKYGFAIVLKSRWEKYHSNAIISDWESDLNSARDARTSFEMADNARYLIIHCKNQYVIDVIANKNEKIDEFISRFMNSMKTEYPEPEQRLAVAYSYWHKQVKDNKSYTLQVSRRKRRQRLATDI